MGDTGAAAVDTREAWQREVADFDDLDRETHLCGMNRTLTKFHPLVFWAAPRVKGRFPVLSALARGEFSGLAAEATSERTFSYSGRAFGKQRRRLAAEQLCALVVGFSFKGEVTDVEIRDHMKSRSRREAAEE